ncbi:hypothetical protein ANN_02667 [Periplaneta americana]|uniref:Uncharacterized protein n=1 Tax=Periplaneta americana TaxID=6978 RepID=A0ABQ8TYN1_PERAM|nr:hypothetical protein ANN_02667 [Periplaneta americana]
MAGLCEGGNEPPGSLKARHKNRMILMVLIYIIAKKHFDSVDLKFLVSEHPYMSCDREFGIIEKRKKKMQDHGSRRDYSQKCTDGPALRPVEIYCANPRYELRAIDPLLVPTQPHDSLTTGLYSQHKSIYHSFFGNFPQGPLSVRGETPPPSRSASAEAIQRRLATYPRRLNDMKNHKRDDEERMMGEERKWRR